MKGFRRLYSKLKKKQNELKKLTPTYLTQQDFDDGTYNIKESGYYKLKENIIFHPKNFSPENPSLAFVLGFFAVIAIPAEDVYLDLNGFSISASEEFALHQRFFSIIELADAPFIPSQGPANFSTSIQSGKNVIVENGTLGRSSHHGIHGNLAENILIEDLKIEDFEFVGVAINGKRNIILSNLEIESNLKDIPVLATFSAAHFAKMFAEKLLNGDNLNEDQRTELENRLDVLETEMNQTRYEALHKKKITSDLFRNESGLPDGNIYAVVIKNKGVAVNDFVTNGEKTENVFLEKVRTKDLKCRVDEVIGLSGKGGKGVQNDVAGAVLQIEQITNYDGTYAGTVLSDLQLYLAELALALNISLGKNNITADTIAWSKSGKISSLLNKGYKYKCGGDSMFHFNKGCIGYRFDACNNLLMRKCSLKSLKNKGRLGNEKLAGQYEKSHDEAKRKGYFGCDSTGINLSYCSEVCLYKCYLEKIKSSHGTAIGINNMFSTISYMRKIKIRNIKAGKLRRGKWRGKDYYNNWVEYNSDMPNRVPIAIGIKFDKTSWGDLEKVSICDLRSCKKPIKILKE